MSQETPVRSKHRFFMPPRRWILRLSIEMLLGSYLLLRAVSVTRSSCAEQPQVSVFPHRYFMKIPTGVVLRSYPLLELLVSEEVPARCIRRLLYLLVFTSRDPNLGGIVQLSPIRAVIATRSTCVEQSQVFVSLRQYFLRPPTGLDLGSYSLSELLF